jgi:hypothetical protein
VGDAERCASVHTDTSVHLTEAHRLIRNLVCRSGKEQCGQWLRLCRSRGMHCPSRIICQKSCITCRELLFYYFLWLYISQWLGCELGDRSSIPSRGNELIFLFTTASKPPLGPTLLPTRWVPGALVPEVKRPGREADHAPPPSAEVKNAWSYNFTSPYLFMV